jgi:hypothetical protein
MFEAGSGEDQRPAQHMHTIMVCICWLTRKCVPDY